MSGAQTIAGLADRAAERYGDEEALVFGEDRWTFAELRDRVARAARAVIAQGVRPGDAVAVWAPNSARWVVAALGAVAAGGVLVPVNTRYKAAEATDILRRSRTRLLFTEHDFLGTDYRALLADAGEQLPLLERTVALHTPDWSRFLSGAERVTAQERLARTHSVRPTDTADILFTSGTTGRPKGAPATHAQNLRVYDAWARAVTLRRGDRYLLVNPFFHTFGYKAGIIACLLHGATIVPEQVFDAGTVLHRIQHERISVLTGAPTVFTSLVRHPGRETYDLTSMRTAVTGAANIPTELIAQIRELLGARNVCTAYGLTEATGVVTICPPHESPETLARTCGTALEGTELRIDAPPGEPGEILTRGHHVMPGYLDEPEATAEAVDADGWLHTGDVGVLDERGFLRITDRLKDMFVVGGFNVYPAEVEQVLRGHPAVADAAVVGTPDGRLGEVGVAYCVPAAGARIDAAELTAYTRERLANFKVPRAFHRVTELPHNAAGKVDKGALRRLARAAAQPLDAAGRPLDEESTNVNDSNRSTESVDVVVVGAGVTGLYAVHKLRGLGYRVRGFERGDDVGGVWYWNRYPGARCDVESVDYSYSFDEDLQQEWDWSEKYATQPEIMDYLRHVADRFDLRRSYTFATSVTSAELDEESLRWTVRTDRGQVVSARFCVFAVGCLSSTHLPDIPGAGEFTGATYHTGEWPHDGVDFTGLRVGVIGTGSSGIQSIPLIAEQAARLTVFQRSANYSIPAGNEPLDDAARSRQKAGYPERRRLSRLSGGGSPHMAHSSKAFEVSEDERRAAFEKRWELGGVLYAKTFPDQLSDLRANEAARAFWEEKVRALIDDPEVADLLVPTDHPIGTKRIVTDSDYYGTFNRDDVRLVSLRENPIERIEAAGIALADGTVVELDAIVFATGFDAMTGAVDRIDVRGRAGRRLKDVWEAGPRTYLGLAVDGFPNLFNLTGPGSPSVLANVVLCAEQHGDWLADCLRHLDTHGYRAIEAREEAVEQWVTECRDRAAATLYPSANSWYLGANIPGKPRVFMPFIGGLGAYGEIIAEVADTGYQGFDLIRG